MQEWLISTAFGDKALVEWAASAAPRRKELILMPYAATAARVAEKKDDEPWKLAVMPVDQGRYGTSDLHSCGPAAPTYCSLAAVRAAYCLLLTSHHS